MQAYHNMQVQNKRVVTEEPTRNNGDTWGKTNSTGKGLLLQQKHVQIADEQNLRKQKQEFGYFLGDS